jgi:DNA polymerase (family 10)
MNQKGSDDRRRGLAGSLWRLADLVQAHEGRRSFRAKAYRKVVWSLDELSVDLSDVAETMLRVKGIGPGVVRLIDEYRSTGRLVELDRLAALYPAQAGTLRRLPRMTPAMLRQLKADLGVDTEADIYAAIDVGEIDSIRGLGPATAERWRLILGSSKWTTAMPAFHASVLAGDVARHLGRHLRSEVHVAGSVRRTEEWVEQLDLVAVASDSGPASDFLDTTAIARRSARIGPNLARLQLHAGLPANVHITSPAFLGSALIRATGPAEHADALLLGWEGDAPDETLVYRAAGLPPIPAPARHLPPEIATAVVRRSDLRGDLHLHTDWSPDGRLTLAELCEKTATLGYEYILITDHAVGLRFGGLDARALDLQSQAIESARSWYPELRIFQGAELNIDADGCLDLEEDALSRLDFAVAAIHSNFDLDRNRQTSRLVTAMGHPRVRVLAHLTGRRIGIRPAIEIDFEAVVREAVARGVALEINGHRDRLDLSSSHVRKAAAAGARFAANSDAHRPGELENVENAIAILQTAGVSPDSVVNTWPVGRFARWATGELPVDLGDSGAVDSR